MQNLIIPIVVLYFETNFNRMKTDNLAWRNVWRYKRELDIFKTEFKGGRHE